MEISITIIAALGVEKNAHSPWIQKQPTEMTKAEVQRRRQTSNRLNDRGVTIPLEHSHVMFGTTNPPSSSVRVPADIDLQEMHACGSHARTTAKQLVPLLSPSRARGDDGWAKVGWVIAHIFGGDDEGRTLFHDFSHRASNHDVNMVNYVYDTSDGRVTFGSLVAWAKEDDLGGAMAVMQDAAPVIGDRLDEDVIYEMVNDFNIAWGPMVKIPTRRGEYPEEYIGARDVLNKRIVLYMNHWMCIIRGISGPPIVVEETVDTDGNIKFVLCNQRDAGATYKRHTLRVVGDNKTTTPMTIWSNNRHSRQYDTIVFNPDPAVSTPRSFNLYRGPAITEDMSVQDDEAVKIVTDHIRTRLASGNAKITTYLLDWMAHLVQRPWIQMITVPVFKGGQDEDRRVIGQKLGAIIGSAHIMAVTGQFQEERIKTSLLTFLDGCTFASDRKQRSNLKRVLSDGWRRWHLNSIRIQNSSDSRWVTAESKSYFGKLAAVDPRHFAYFLYNRDISNFTPSAIRRSPVA